jgi:hypothetical protein
MDTDFPGDKAFRRCDRAEIHCCTHPVEIADGQLFMGKRQILQGEAVDQSALQELAGILPAPFEL